MRDAKSISADPPANPGLDFEQLRQEGIEIIQQLAGRNWTDYNEHDPGITILEQLCFALTELSYRAELPIEDLLCDARGCLDPATTALFPAHSMLTGAPVTTDDYRRLLIDRVPGVGNAWMTPAESRGGRGGAGLHEIDLYVPGNGGDAAAARRTAVRTARRVYAAHRALCEDCVGVHVLTEVPARLHATVAIDRATAPDAILARILYEVSLFLAPEVRREPLSRYLPGTSLLDIFSGPAVRSGFVPADQLRPRVTHVTLADLVRTIEGIAGVVAVRNVHLSSALGNAGPRDEPGIPIHGRRVLRLQAEPLDGPDGVRLLRDGAPCRTQPAIARRELEHLWADHRRRYDIRSEYERLVPSIEGKHIDDGAYHSIQHHFPAVYGINAYGLGSEVSDTRRAQARQLKAYLLPFEQILAEAGARLGTARHLFSTRGAIPRGAARLDETVPDAEAVLAPSYQRGMQALTDRFRTSPRRSRALDLMLATYGEELGQPLLSFAAVTQPGAGGDDAHGRAKRAMLRRIPWLGARRGCGRDYLAPARSGAHVSAEVKTRIQLGMNPMAEPLADVLASEGVTLIGTAPQSERVAMIRHARHIDATFEPVEHVPRLVRHRVPAARTMTEDLLLGAGDQSQYRMGTLPGSNAFTVVCRTPSQPVWQLVGHFGDRDTALQEVSQLLATVGRIEPRARRLTIVEHALLRFGRHAGRALDHLDAFDYDFTVTAVVALPAREASDAAHRDAVEDLLRANIPAHIVLDVLFLRLSEVVTFERIHAEWLRAMRDGGGLERMETSRRLRMFLQAGAG